jgi:hypothetical protein
MKYWPLKLTHRASCKKRMIKDTFAGIHNNIFLHNLQKGPNKQDRLSLASLSSQNAL